MNHLKMLRILCFDYSEKQSHRKNSGAIIVLCLRDNCMSFYYLDLGFKKLFFDLVNT